MQALPALAIGAQVGGQLVKGIGGYEAGKFNASVADQNSTEALRAGAAQEMTLRRDARAQMGEQIAAQGEGGFQTGTGSAADAITQSAIAAHLDIMNTRRKALLASEGYQIEAGNQRMAAHSALVSGMFGAASALAGGMYDYAGSRKAGS